jgi:hypothetical protein
MRISKARPRSVTAILTMMIGLSALVAAQAIESSGAAALAPTVPGPPTNVTATAGNYTATVSWTPPADDGGSPITRYMIRAVDGSTFGSIAAPATSIFLQPVAGGHQYQFTVSAENAVGTSADSAPSNPVTPTAFRVPSEPNLRNIRAGFGEVTLGWDAPVHDGGSPVTSYTVTAMPGGITKTVAGLNATITGLTNGQTYRFTVYAANAIGNGPGSAYSPSIQIGMMPGPAGPVTAVALDRSRVQVTWNTAPPNGGPVKGYFISYRDDEPIRHVPPDKRSVIFEDLTNGEIYTFTVWAFNDHGSGPNSTSNEATPSDIADQSAPFPFISVPFLSYGLSTQHTVQWWAEDPAGIQYFDVRRRVASWNGSPGAWASMLNATLATSSARTATTGRTYCYAVRAMDNVGNLSGWSSSRCTAVPLRSDHLLYSKGWRKVPNASKFGGFSYQTTLRNAKVTRTGIVAKKLALVATTCSRCGTVQVRWNGKLLKTLNLRSSTTVHTRVFEIASYSSAQRGTFTVTNTSTTGKLVTIEGVAVYNS